MGCWIHDGVKKRDVLLVGASIEKREVGWAGYIDVASPPSSCLVSFFFSVFSPFPSLLFSSLRSSPVPPVQLFLPSPFPLHLT